MVAFILRAVAGLSRPIRESPILLILSTTTAIPTRATIRSLTTTRRDSTRSAAPAVASATKIRVTFKRERLPARPLLRRSRGLVRLKAQVLYYPLTPISLMEIYVPGFSGMFASLFSGVLGSGSLAGQQQTNCSD